MGKALLSEWHVASVMGDSTACYLSTCQQYFEVTFNNSLKSLNLNDLINIVSKPTVLLNHY